MIEPCAERDKILARAAALLKLTECKSQSMATFAAKKLKEYWEVHKVTKSEIENFLDRQRGISQTVDVVHRMEVPHLAGHSPYEEYQDRMAAKQWEYF